MAKSRKKLKNTVHPEVVSKAVVQPTNILQQYLQEISKFPVLSPDDELKWSRLYYDTKDARALKILIQSNLRFVVKIAAEYNRFGSKLIDLIQEGNIGLLKAIKEFNPYKGVRLITYAVWWIRGAIQEHLMRQHSIVRVGTTSKQKKLFYLLRKEGLPDVGSPMDPALISRQLQIPQKEVDSMKALLSSKDVSFDGGEYGGGIHIKEQEDSLEDQFVQEEKLNLLKKAVKKIRASLDDREIYILENRVLSKNPQTLQEIGRHFNVTREFIRQLESKLIEKIKKQMILSNKLK